MKERRLSDDSSERLWLVLAFMSSSESYVMVIMHSALNADVNLAAGFLFIYT